MSAHGSARQKPASSKKTANTCSLSQSDLGAAAYGQGGPDNTPTECSKNCPKAWGNLGCEAVSFEEAAWEMGTTVESRGTINGQRAPQTVPPAKEAQRRATKAGSLATETHSRARTLQERNFAEENEVRHDGRSPLDLIAIQTWLRVSQFENCRCHS